MPVCFSEAEPRPEVASAGCCRVTRVALTCPGAGVQAGGCERIGGEERDRELPKSLPSGSTGQPWGKGAAVRGSLGKALLCPGQALQTRPGAGASWLLCAPPWLLIFPSTDAGQVSREQALTSPYSLLPSWCLVQQLHLQEGVWLFPEGRAPLGTPCVGLCYSHGGRGSCCFPAPV